MWLKHKTVPAISISLRTILSTPYILLIILAIATVGYIAFLNGQAAVNDVARQLRSETALGIKQHLTTFLNVPHQINQFNAYAIQSGELNPNDISVMQQHFLEQVRIHPSITSAYFGSAKGGLVGGGREGAEGSLYVTSTENLQSGNFQKFGVDESGKINPDALTTVPDFNARTRPWYIMASQKGDAAWSDIYVLFTGQDMAIAASRPVYDEHNNLLGVVSVDIFLSQLSKYLETLSISPIGQVFIMERSGALVATSTGEALFKDVNNDGKKERIGTGDSQSAVIRQSGSLLIQKYGDYKSIPTDDQQLEFTLDGEKQFLQFQSVRDPYGIDWIVVAVIPELAFMEHINAGNRVTMWLIIAALAITILVSMFVTSKITNRISQLDQSTQALAAGEWDLELDSGTRIAELNRLAVSFNQMKEQLRHTLDNLTTEIADRKCAEERVGQIANELQVTLDTVTVGISHIKDRKIEWANAAHDEMFGYDFGETHGMEIASFFTDEAGFQQLGQDAYPQLLAGKTFSVEMEMRRRDGARFWCSLTGRVVNLKRPGEGAIWVLQDITERKRTEKTIEEEITRRRILFEESPNGILVIDPKTARFLEFNTMAHQQLGYTREEFAQLSIADVDAVETPDEIHQRIENVIQAGKGDFDTFQRTRQGEIRNVHVSAQIVNIQGTPVYYCIWRDVTKQKRIEEELRDAKDAIELANHNLELALIREQELSHIDELTGINNRRSLFELAELKLAVASRYEQPLSVVMFDIDHFKRINDTFGHTVGDQILTRVAQVVCAELRSADVIGRYGGEEFILLLPMTKARKAYILAERIRRKVNALRVPSEKGEVSITISIGIVEIAHISPPESVEAVFIRADEAMYAAKQAGRNCTMVLDSK